MNIAALGVKIDPTEAQRGAAQVKAAVNDMAKTTVDSVAKTEQASKNAAKGATEAAKQHGAAVQDVAAKSRKAAEESATSMRNLVGIYQTMAQAVAAITGGMALTAAISEGIKFNSMLQDSVIGIASVQRQFNPEKFRTIGEAMKASADAVETLKKKAEESPATFQALVQGFQSTAGAAAKANLTMKQHIDLVVMTSQAMKALGIAEEQMKSEMRALFSGNINADSDTAKMLGITKQDIENATAAGNLFDFLSGKMAAFAEAGKVAGQSLSVMLSNIQDKVQQALGQFALPAFRALSDQLSKLLNEVGKAGGGGAFDALSQAVGTAVKWFGELIRMLVRNIDTVMLLAKAVTIYVLATKTAQFATWIAGLLASKTAVDAETAALQRNAAARRMRGIGVGVAAGAAAMAGGGMFSMLGAGLGTALGGPVGAIIGMGLGLVADKIKAGYDKAKESVASTKQTLDEVTKTLQQQIGLADTYAAKVQARAAIERQIANLTASMVGKSAQEIEMLKQKVKELKAEMDGGKYGSIILDNKGAEQINKAAQIREESLRRQIDLADTAAKKEAARLAIWKQVNEVYNKIVEATKQGAYGQNAQLDSLKAYKATLGQVLADFDKMAGTHELEKQAAAKAVQDQAAVEKILGDQLKTAEAKLTNDTALLQNLEDQRRIQELKKTAGLEELQNSKALLGIVQQITAAERARKEADATVSFRDTENTIRLQGLKGEQRRAELQRQYKEQQNFSAEQLRNSGVTGVPDSLTASSVMKLNSPGFGVGSNVDAMGKLVPEAQKLARYESELASSAESIEKASAKIADNIPSDASTILELRKQKAQIASMLNKGQMSGQEAFRRSREAEESAGSSLVDPQKYAADIGRIRAFELERERISRETDDRIKTNNAGMIESLSSGVEKATNAWGNFNQQVEQMGSQMMGLLSDGISASLTDIITGTKTAGEAFRDMANTFLREITNMIMKLIIQLALQMAINAATGKPTTNNFGSIVQSVTGVAVGKARGGAIYGGRGAIDDIPAMLTAGEYVLNRDAVKAIGMDNLDQMNSMKPYASGGRVGYGAAGAGGRGGGNVNVNVAVNVAGGASKDEDPETRKKKERQLGGNIEAAVRSVIIREKRPGGLLN